MPSINLMSHRALERKASLRWPIVRAAKAVDKSVIIARNWAEPGVFVFKFSDGSVIRTADWRVTLPTGFEHVRVQLKQPGVFTPVTPT